MPDQEESPLGRQIGRSPTSLVNAAQIFIAGVLGLGVAWWLRPVLAPIAIAWLGKVALSPIVRFASARGLPKALTAGLIVVALMTTGAGSIFLLSNPASDWLKRLPGDIKTLQQRWEDFSHPSGEMAEVAGAVDDLVGSATDDSVDEVRVVDSTPLMVRTLDEARGLLGQFAILWVLLFFMLANDRGLLNKWEKIARSPEEAQRARTICDAIENQCGRYLISISAINVCLGVAVGLAVGLLGLPNPLLWGVVAAALNFIPFVGAAVGVGIVAVVGVSTMPTIAEGLLPPAAYLVLTGFEGLMITPAILGRSIKLSPVAVLIWLMLWGWLWGLAGALLAVPILAAVTIVCRNVPGWRPVATLVEA